MSDDTRTGLMSDDGAIPLQGVKVEASLRLGAARVRVLQRYRNTEDRPVEAVYVFPLPEGSAVCGFVARVGDRLIQGAVEEKEKAFERYDDAMMDGDGAFLLEQERPDVFTVSVGNLEPGAEVVLAITYVSHLHREDDAMRFALPTTISPRYVPEHVVDAPVVGQPEWERVTPPVALQVPYGVQVEVEARMGTTIRSVASPSHPVEVEVDGDTARVRFASREHAMDRDFVLLLRSEAADRPAALLQREQDGTLTAVVTLLPALEETAPADSETIFLVDCSGSMGGSSMDEARRALRLCLRSLSPGAAFNVVRFGSSHEQLWPTSQVYGNTTLAEADRYAGAMRADLGGTEILRPLRSIVAREGLAQRQVILLTDGQVANEPEVVALAREHRDTVRIFTFGIGAGASEYLVRGVARASRGAAEFIHPGERVEPKVLRQFNRIASPPLTGVRVDCEGADVELANREVPPVFDGDALTLLLRVRRGTPASVVLCGESAAGALRAEAVLDGEAEMGDLAATLWARERIRELEEGDAAGASPRGSNQRGRREQRRSDEILALALRHGLVSSRTSFVAVEVRDEADRTREQAELRRVPVALTTGWGAVPRQRPIMPTPMAAAGPVMPSPASPPMAAQVRAKRSAFGGLADSIRGAVDFAARPARSRARRESARMHGFDAASAFEEMACEACEDDLGSGDLHLDLLLLQRADGSFPVDQRLAALTGVPLDEVRAIAGGMDLDEAVVATVAALRTLQREAADRRDEWRRAAAKADRWLAGANADRAVVERALAERGF